MFIAQVYESQFSELWLNPDRLITDYNPLEAGLVQLIIIFMTTQLPMFYGQLSKLFINRQIVFMELVNDHFIFYWFWQLYNN